MTTAVSSPSPSPARPLWFWGLIGLLATCSVAAQLQPVFPTMFGLSGPGQTLDEMFNAELGVQTADRVLAGDISGALNSTTLLPDHPPAGRLWLGLVHELSTLFLAVPLDRPVSIALARLGSALAFGIMIALLGRTAERWWGRACGLWAAGAVWLIPRLFGHAHLAALESVLNLVFVWCVIQVAQWSHDQPVPSWRRVLSAGFWFGLVWLTKIQAILLPLPVLVWAVWHWKGQGALRWLVWCAVSGLVLLVGWPWLWDDPAAHLSQYLGRTTDRAAIQVWYLGRAWADNAVPRHYAAVLFLTTFPVAYQLILGWGIWQERKTLLHSPRETLVILVAIAPLMVFSLPGVAVYDGARLFLVSYPLWGLLVGKWGPALFAKMSSRWGVLTARSLTAGVVASLLVRMISVSPCWLSDYNLAIGGLRGAQSLGLATTYWGDSLTPQLLRATERLVPAGARLAIIPELHQFQIPALQQEWPHLANESWTLIRSEALRPGDYVLVFTRQEYLPVLPWKTYELLAETRRQGVQLAALYRVR